VRGLRLAGPRRRGGAADWSKIHKEYFERTLMGTTVGGGSRKVRHAYDVMNRRKGGAAELDALLGILARQAHRLPTVRSPGTTQRYNGLARELGLLPSDVVEPNLEAMRLDYVTGRLVRGDEALSCCAVVGSPCRPNARSDATGAVSWVLAGSAGRWSCWVDGSAHPRLRACKVPALTSASYIVWRPRVPISSW